MNANANAEFIAKTTYNKVLEYFKVMIDPLKLNEILREFHIKFPTWADLWQTLRVWLQKNPMNAMRQSIHSFAKLFPNYNSFSRDLDNSLVLDEIFWNEVHMNLCKAKGQLIC